MSVASHQAPKLLHWLMSQSWWGYKGAQKKSFMDPEACLCCEGSLLDLLCWYCSQNYCAAVHTAPSLCCSLMCTSLRRNLQSRPKWLRISLLYFPHREPKISVNTRICGASRGPPGGKLVGEDFHKWSGEDHLEVETAQMQIKSHWRFPSR